MIYKVICVGVLCFLLDGATLVVGKECNYGATCKPHKSCQTTQIAYSFGQKIELFCNSRGKEILVCCYDRIANIIPFAPTVLLYANSIISSFHNTVGNSFKFSRSRTNPPRTTTDAYGQYLANTNRPQQPIATRLPGYGSHPIAPIVPITSTNTDHGQYPTGFSYPQRPIISSNQPVVTVTPVSITNTNHWQYPTGTSRPQWPVSNNRPDLPITSVNSSHWMYPTGNIHPQRPIINSKKPVVPVAPITNINTNHGPYPTGTSRPEQPISNNRPDLPTIGTNPSHGQYPTGSSNPQRPINTSNQPVVTAAPVTGTNTNHGHYPTGNSHPQRPIISANNVPVESVTSINTNHGQYPTGTSRPEQPISNNRPDLPTTITNSSYGHSTGTIRFPQEPPTSTAYHGSPTTSTTAKPVATTNKPSPTTTEYMPPVYDYVPIEPVLDGCTDLDSANTTNKIGRPAWDKCIEYQQHLVYPCQRSVTLLGNMVRLNNCEHTADNRDKIARFNEFPHVVVLGVRGRAAESLQWACSGTLISERFTLSSAYCLSGINERYEIYAAVGVMQRKAGNVEAYKEHKIETIHYYQPTYDGHTASRTGYYKKDTRYHDIALLKSATKINLNQWVVPACLDVFGDKDFNAVATRWRERSWDVSNVLQKIFVRQLSKTEYMNKFPGVKDSVANQVGYGSYGSPDENCKSNNGGSLTVENHLVNCMYTVKALFSSVIRPTCGQLPSASYTKVSNYISWIEKIVWPNENTIV